MTSRRRILTAVVVGLVAMLVAVGAAGAANSKPLFSKNATDQGYGGVGGNQPGSPSNGGTSNGTDVAAVNTTVHTSGTLPFTGAQLGVFVVLGLALIAGGFMLHRAGRGRSRA